jgi:hypothetical protein
MERMVSGIRGKVAREAASELGKERVSTLWKKPVGFGVT